MVSDRLKGIIYKQLNKVLGHVEIIDYNGEIWFIDREDKYWYFIYRKSNGELWWRYSFFASFFSLFSLSSNELNFILSSWVEEVLNCKVVTTNFNSRSKTIKVEEVLNCKVSTTEPINLEFGIKSEEALTKT